MSRPRRASVYQCADVGSLGRHFSHAGLLGAMHICSPSQATVNLRCGLSQANLRAICKNLDFASPSFEHAETGIGVVIRLPFFTTESPQSYSILGSWRIGSAVNAM